MATSDNIDNKSSETFCLIWLDSSPNEGRNTEQKLRSIINQLKKFQEIDLCQEFIQKTSAKDRLILIVSGRLGKEILPKIHHLRQVISIYIYCMDKKVNEQWSSKYSKVKNVITNLDELVSVISKDYQIEKQIEEPLSINIFSIGGKSTVGLNGKFVFSQILIDCLLRLESIDQDKNELIQMLKQQFYENRFELDNIKDFEKKYQSNEVLQWYTKECFFYKTLNSILRTETIHWIFLYRSFISDLQQQLQKYQSNKILQVYRAQIISKDELENLKQSINQFISINSFFSTTSSYQKALSFFNHSKSTENTEKILFTIQADPHVVKTKPFANISQFSDYPDEEEVLFMIGSIFRLTNISYDQKNQFSIIQMTLSSDDDNQLKQVLAYMKQQTGYGPTNLKILAKILLEMGKFDLAEQYLKRLLNQVSLNDPIRGDVYEDLAKIFSISGDFDKSMEWHQKSIEFKQNNPTASSSSSSSQLKDETILRWKQYGKTIAGGNDAGDKLNQLNWPQGIYIDNQHQFIYIADCDNHRILKWNLGDNSGQIIAGGNGKGDRIDQLSFPHDMIIDQHNKSLIICDQGNRRVVQWSLENPKDKRVIIEDIYCWGLMMNKNGDLFVSDAENHDVKRWKRGQKEGTIVAGRNGQGDKLDQLNFPTFIFVDREDTVYISDYSNHRVVKWLKGAKEGIIVAGGHGQGNTLKQLYSPMGLFVNEVGDVYIADSKNARIICWPSGSKKGRIVVGGNSFGKESNQFNSLRGLSFDVMNNLYVADFSNHRIQRFDIE